MPSKLFSRDLNSKPEKDKGPEAAFDERTEREPQETEDEVDGNRGGKESKIVESGSKQPEIGQEEMKQEEMQQVEMQQAEIQKVEIQQTETSTLTSQFLPSVRRTRPRNNTYFFQVNCPIVSQLLLSIWMMDKPCEE